MGIFPKEAEGLIDDVYAPQWNFDCRYAGWRFEQRRISG
jgi:hypothetical protein